MSRTSVDSVESLATGRAPLPRVNLLPPEVHQARQARRVQLALGAGVAFVALAVGGVYLMETQDANAAKESLSAAQAKSATLEAQKAQYADVPKTLAAIDAAETARETAMAKDVQWYRYLNDLSYVTPKSAFFMTVDVTLTPDSAANSQAPAIGAPGVATVAVTGAAKAHNDVASWLNAAAREAGWNDTYFTNSEKADINGTTFVKFTSSANVTNDALSHRYDRKAG
jgi:Tfp pilus assembly protein PilN